MIKKSLIIGSSLFIMFFATSILFQSCGCEVKVCNFTFNATSVFELDSLNQNLDDGIDTNLNGMEFFFHVFNEANNPGCAWLNLGFNSAYAFTQYCTVLNPIIPESYVVKLDKGIYHNNDTIPSNTNLINYPSFKNHWIKEGIETGSRDGSINGIIRLDSTINSQINFEAGIYEVEFGFATEDGQNLSSKIEVVYKL